ncbi:MAG TPA: copper chaperone PCu(A)C [Sphingomicrobium sp.]|nr:copper chaperone PCu(A)C [Sphingomicrobium sp.]
MKMPLLSALLLIAACSPTEPMIEVRNAWARETAPGQSSGAVYANIVNRGEGDLLTGATSKRAAAATLHSSTTENGVSKMRTPAGVAIPGGATVALTPGGTHVMLEGLRSPLVAGETIAVTLRFAKAGPKIVTAAVTAAGAR